MNSDFNRNSLPYDTFFDQLDCLTIEQLFPVLPVSDNILDDITQRAFNFPYLLRKMIMSHFKWNIVRYLEKTKADANHANLTAYEQRTLLKITLQVLSIYSTYLKNHYYDEKS